MDECIKHLVGARLQTSDRQTRKSACKRAGKPCLCWQDSQLGDVYVVLRVRSAS